MTTMRKSLLIAAALTLSTLGGCVTLSMNPLYEADDVVAEPVLAGLWGDGQSTDSWQFLPRGDGSYELIIREEDTLRVDPERDAVFTVHLVAIGDGLFLDLFPEEPSLGDDFYKCHIVPAHSFWSVLLEGNVMTIRAMDSSEVYRGIEDGRIEIEHVMRDETAFLTAPTPELQRFVVEHREEIFAEGERLIRLR